jgi:hypothetical protein
MQFFSPKFFLLFLVSSLFGNALAQVRGDQLGLGLSTATEEALKKDGKFQLRSFHPSSTI